MVYVEYIYIYTLYYDRDYVAHGTKYIVNWSRKKSGGPNVDSKY